ncbi:MAG TPA: helicase-associated domain-containing protein, partial [Spirochaetia bacterium]|nr:helicase-associated domain-containing protein [Spirochaetia bacterium]
CGYMADHYSARERSHLHESLALLPNDLPRIAGFVSSVEWLGAALERAGPPQDADGLAAARALLRFFRDRRERVTVRDLADYFPRTEEDELAAGIRVGVQRAVFFLCLRRSDLEPIIGVWPAAVRRLRRMAVVLAPEPLAAARTFSHPFLIEDMTTILLAARVEPVPLRRGDDKPFAKFVEETSAALLSVPEWLESFTGLTMEARITLALQALRVGGLLGPEAAQRGMARGSAVLVPLFSSGDWLDRPLDARREPVLRFLSEGASGPSRLFDLLEEDWTSSEGAREQIMPWLVQAFSSVPLSSFIRFRDFAEYQAAMGSPLAVASQASGQDPSGPGAPPAAATEEALEELWKSFLGVFLGRCLLSLGGAEAGLSPEGAACFRLTPVGRRMLGLPNEGVDGDGVPEDGQGVIVQPNFEVVFFAPSPAAEAELGRFSERVGREVGVLFRLTKQSIRKAAAAGLREEHVLEPLARLARGGLPPNVEHEIRGWLQNG